jgi:hypothetical protein
MPINEVSINREEFAVRKTKFSFIARVMSAAVSSLLLLVLPSLASAQVLYGITHFGPDGPSTLYTIDTLTGAGTPVGPVGFEKCSGIDFDASGTLFAVCERPDGTDTSVLTTIDTSTGTGTEVGPTGISTLGFGSIVPDISIRGSDGALFAYIIGGQALAMIDTSTGTATAVGPANVTTCCGNGIAFYMSSLLYHANESDLNMLSTVTGSATFVRGLNYSPPADAFPRVNSIDFNPVTGGLYASVNDGSSLFPENFLAILDIATGNVNIVGLTVDGLHAIAFQAEPLAAPPAFAVPAASEWSMLIFAVLAGLVSVFYLRRLKREG